MNTIHRFILTIINFQKSYKLQYSMIIRCFMRVKLVLDTQGMSFIKSIDRIIADK